MSEKILVEFSYLQQSLYEPVPDPDQGPQGYRLTKKTKGRKFHETVTLSTDIQLSDLF
jgi:hypothetical protein